MLLRKNREPGPCFFDYIWILSLFLNQSSFQSKRISVNVPWCVPLNPTRLRQSLSEESRTHHSYCWLSHCAIGRGLGCQMIPKTELVWEDAFSGSSWITNWEFWGRFSVFVTPKLPANTLSRKIIVIFWTLESRTTGEQLLLALSLWKSSFSFFRNQGSFKWPRKNGN